MHKIKKMHNYSYSNKLRLRKTFKNMIGEIKDI